MYIYHVLINTLNAHTTHINLNMTFYTHVEHSPTKTIYIKYYMEKQTDLLSQIILNPVTKKALLCCWCKMQNKIWKLRTYLSLFHNVIWVTSGETSTLQ